MRCDRCGRDSPDEFRFCGACGAPLPQQDSVAAEGERKVISALFCDLVGFTPRAELMDPEDVHRLLRTYYASVRGEFERFGGTVAKFIGDAVFVVFGAPRAHEDDPERAVRAALAGVDAVASLNAAQPELDLHVHIGVTTGEALVTFEPRPDQQGGLAWGDILNTASRLEAAAPADTIFVDDPTYQATRHAIEYAPVEPVHARGKAEPVAVWQPLGPLARRGLDLDQASRKPLVDRRDELAALLEAVDLTSAQAAPRLVTLVGDPGIGKSRIVFELFRSLEARSDLINWRHGRSPPYPDGITFWALGEIVKGQAGILATDGATTAASKLGRAVRALVSSRAEAARIERQLQSLVGLGHATEIGGDQRGAAFAAWRHFIEALASQRPLIIVFEDIHWADDGLLDFIEHLAEWTQDVPLLIVSTARPELFGRRPDLGQMDNATTLSLSPLSDDDSRELVSSLAGESGMPEQMTEAIVAHASGNPLYSVEFVRMLADRGLLGSAAAQGDLGLGGALPLPGSVRGIIASRLDSLSHDDKRLLQAASVIGRAVWPGALAAVTGRPRRWVLQRLAALEHREFMARTRASAVENEAEYRFQHALIRDVAYGEIPRRRRGDMHRRTAEWIESLSPDRAVDRADLLAHHYLSAYQLAHAIGGETADLARRARLALRHAGDRALSLQAFPAAARLFRSALELWPEEDPERPWLLFRLGKSMYYAETSGADVLELARDGLLAAGDRGTAAEAEAVLAILAHHHGKREEVAGHLERAAALVADLGPTRSKAEVLVDLANHLAIARDDERAIRVATEALEIARSTRLPELEASALSIIGLTRGWSGDVRGHDDLRQSIAITEQIGSHLSAHCYALLADLECQSGNLASCFELQAHARRHAERFGHAGFMRWLTAERVGEDYWTGAWDEAIEVADSYIAGADAGLPNFMDGYCRAMRGRIRLARGEEARALVDAAGALQFARIAEDLQMLYPALAFGARAEVAAGSPDAGAALADELLALWAANIDAYPTSSWAVDLACALEALGRGEDLVDIAKGVSAGTRWLEAVVPLLSGDPTAAAEVFRQIGSLPDEALARALAARDLLAAGNPDGRAELETALAFYRRVGAEAYLHDAQALATGSVATE